jgi:hypothetical protein
MLVAGKWDAFEKTMKKKYQRSKSSRRGYCNYFMPGM